MISVKRDELAHTEAGVGKQRDNRLITSLKVRREGIGEAGVVDDFDLFGSEPSGGLLSSA